MKLKNCLPLLVILTLFIQCGEKSLRREEITIEIVDYVDSLYQLEDDEEILLFYPPRFYKIKGSFYTNKRAGRYYLYEKYPEDHYIKQLYFEDIDYIAYSQGDRIETVTEYTLYSEVKGKLVIGFDLDTIQTFQIYKELKEFLQTKTDTIKIKFKDEYVESID